jgi:uncharacterized cupin superfamily protein
MKMKLAMTGLAFVAGALFAAHHENVTPAKMSKDDIAGEIFDRPDMIAITHDDGHETLDVTTLLSSDKKFASGMYRSTKTRLEVTEPYGVDEFMYFLEGSVTLTSSAL